jgi:hypothetical protein
MLQRRQPAGVVRPKRLIGHGQITRAGRHGGWSINQSSKRWPRLGLTSNVRRLMTYSAFVGCRRDASPYPRLMAQAGIPCPSVHHVKVTSWYPPPLSSRRWHRWTDPGLAYFGLRDRPRDARASR